MHKIVLTALVLAVALFGVNTASANLLADPSFENYTGGWFGLSWTDSPWYGGGGSGIPNNTNIGGGSGITNLHANSGSRSALLYQFGTGADGDTWSYASVGQKNLLVTGNTTYNASIVGKKIGSIAGAQGYLKVSWLDASGGTISTSVGASQLTDAATTGTWVSLSDNFVSPETAAKATFDIVFDRMSTTTGDPNDVVFDNANFDVVPEPASLLLLGSGLVGLFGLGKKKKS